MVGPLRPTHCPDTLDERSWATDIRCTPAFHSWVADAQIAAARWLKAVTEALMNSRIGPINFPSSTGAAMSASGLVVDPSLVYLLIARARRGDDAADVLYVGVVTQTPSALWRGITGFYLPYCSSCHPDPMTTVDRVLDWLPDDARLLLPDRLPEAIRPAPGWFDGRLMLGIHLAGPETWHATSAWATWPHKGRATSTGPALACAGPLGGDLANLLYLHNAQRDLPALQRALRQWSPDLPTNLALTYRTGTTKELLAVAGGVRSATPPNGLRTKTLPGGLTRTEAPICWGGYIVPSRNVKPRRGVTRNLRATVRELRAEGLLSDTSGGAVLYYWADGDGVLSFRDLRRLSRWLDRTVEQD